MRVTGELAAVTQQVAALLVERGLTVAVGEATGCGLIGYILTSVPGSSRYFLGGLSPYSQQAKLQVLGIPEAVLKEKGSVSRETALEMARMIRNLFNADIGLAETGIAGPGGGTIQKPAGLFYIALSNKDGQNICEEHRFAGSREDNRWLAAQSALAMLAKFLRNGSGSGM